ncbi:P-II family nitrogen regulator [Bacillus sp. EB600]|uniref:P-II family nitrogen regulator n=1 Tax=Bacillus sp. EB600 TaxID=2806345 RepID=UPI002109FDA8|nr:P-II family nitrogen regulator [Bacillus sp. EB600]MCQ6280037.1 P-II family nitrogen regulator [Bacillus sp. EB600]
MKKIEAIFRPEKLREVIEELKEINVTSFTVTQVQGRGHEKISTGVYRGRSFTINLHPKVKMEIILSDFKAEKAIQTIIKAAHTGEAGDGKIFVSSILEMHSIRTGEIQDLD